jgi:hypothetical protein
MRKVRKAVVLLVLAIWVARRLRRDATHAGKVSIGFTDGSSTVLDVGSPERELLLATAADAV